MVTRALAAAALGALLLGTVGSFAGGPCPNLHALPAPQPERLAALAALDLGWAQPGPGSQSPACGGKLRPGAQLVIDGSVLCTADWVFRDAQGALFLGTAGHCLPPGARRADVPGAADDIGQVAFTVAQGVGEDFA
ncbi:MAG: S1 family peptidase, partial [Halobacteriales archaeon]|nr:S1 family peptidase [Halobacteriales archaeon]